MTSQALGGLEHAIDPTAAWDIQIERAMVQDRQRPGEAQTHWTGILIGSIAKARRAAAEGLGKRLQLCVDFEPDHRLVTRENVGSQRRRFWCAARHNKVRIIAFGQSGHSQPGGLNKLSIFSIQNG